MSAVESYAAGYDTAMVMFGGDRSKLEWYWRPFYIFYPEYDPPSTIDYELRNLWTRGPTSELWVYSVKDNSWTRRSEGHQLNEGRWWYKAIPDKPPTPTPTPTATVGEAPAAAAAAPAASHRHVQMAQQGIKVYLDEIQDDDDGMQPGDMDPAFELGRRLAAAAANKRTADRLLEEEAGWEGQSKAYAPGDGSVGGLGVVPRKKGKSAHLLPEDEDRRLEDKMAKEKKETFNKLHLAMGVGGRTCHLGLYL